MKADSNFDAVTLEILWSRLISIADESAAALLRTSFSTIVRESNDFATVLMDGKAVYSCLVLAADCPGRSIATVESLADRVDLALLQQAFVDCDGLQRGFCTSGQLMSLEALLHPVATAAVVVVTANHCWSDGLVAAPLVVVGWTVFRPSSLHDGTERGSMRFRLGTAPSTTSVHERYP